MVAGGAVAESSPEFELILLIASQDPRSTASKLLRLNSLGDYQLIPGETRLLHDVYLDTPDHRLGKKRVNLRIRGSGDAYWLTMKISKGLFARKRQEREEFEVPWSKASLNQIVTELSRMGIPLTVPANFTDNSSQVEVMKSMGLVILQDRETERNPRDIIEGEGSKDPLVELAIDSVLYHFEGQDVRLFEVELEAKSKKGRRVLGELSNNLLKLFGSELRAWRFGKLITGEKIQRLLGRGELDGYFEGSVLKPEAYQRIERA